MISSEITEFLAEFRRGTHAILFYHTPEDKRELLFSHLKFGNNEGLAYVCSEENPRQILQEMEGFGIDAHQLRARNRLTVSNYDDVYIVNGEVNNSKISMQFSELAERYRLMGLGGMRAAAEMSCFFQHNKVKELMSYEYAMHRRLSLPAEGICAYNIGEMSKLGQLGAVMPMLRAHDPVIMLGPKESLILEPEKVEDKDVEMTMKVRV